MLAHSAGPRGIVIGLVLSEDEFRLRLRLLRHDLFVLGEFGLAANTAIRGIVDMRLAGNAILPTALTAGIGNGLQSSGEGEPLCSLKAGGAKTRSANRGSSK